MKIVTFNLRLDTERDGEKRFENRKNEIIRKIRDEKPDVIGFQEALPHMLSWLREQLPEYQFGGHGRSAQYDDEANPIACRKDRFAVRAMECFWLSGDPETAGSKFGEECVIFPRICTMMLLHDMQSGKDLRVLNTHLDNRGQKSRKWGLELILKKMQQWDEKSYPTVLMGDFNCKPDAEELAPLAENPDYYDAAADIPYTFHGYHTAQQKIDYIFVSSSIVCSRCYIKKA